MSEVECSILMCQNKLVNGDLKFMHKNEVTGGICNQCLGNASKVRVVLEKKLRGLGGLLQAEHITFLDTL